jgi:hypothetical protein
MSNRSPLFLFYDCEAGQSHLDADIMEIAIQPLQFTDKVCYSFVSLTEKLSKFSKFFIRLSNINWIL